MVVVVIITALSALAIPSILRQMRDRRTRQAAEEIAAIYRQARMRALGRGSAVLVRYDSSNSSYTTLEAVLGGPGCTQQLPSSSCTSTLWNMAPTTLNGAQTLSSWSPLLGITSVAYADATGSGKTTDSPVASLDICFTPMGRALFRTAATPPPATPFAPMSGVPLMKVSRNDASLKRYVVIPPNGLARTDVAAP